MISDVPVQLPPSNILVQKLPQENSEIIEVLMPILERPRDSVPALLTG